MYTKSWAPSCMGMNMSASGSKQDLYEICSSASCSQVNFCYLLLFLRDTSGLALLNAE